MLETKFMSILLLLLRSLLDLTEGKNLSKNEITLFYLNSFSDFLSPRHWVDLGYFFLGVWLLIEVYLFEFGMKFWRIFFWLFVSSVFSLRIIFL